MDQDDTLRAAAEMALLAPSNFNTQPWRWVVRRGRLELWADRTRQLHTDTDGRLLTMSCGVALHHAETAFGAANVSRLPTPDLMARLSPAPDAVPDPGLLAAMRNRRSDRRPFTAEPVPPEMLARIVNAGEQRGAHLHLVQPDQVPVMALAAVRAGALQLSDSGYQAELLDWTHRPAWSGDGVPIESTVDTSPRPVPVRDFAPFGGRKAPPGMETDRGASYIVIFTDDDTPLSWLWAGEALSAVLLTATALGLGTAIISEVTEVAAARDDLRHLIAPRSGHPQVAVRTGHPVVGDPPPRAPRRSADEVIEAASPDSHRLGAQP